VKGKITGPSPIKTSTINNNELTNVFSKTIFRGYHHIKNTHILGLKHKFITSKVDSNKNKERSHQVGINNGATGEELFQNTDFPLSVSQAEKSACLLFFLFFSFSFFFFFGRKSRIVRDLLYANKNRGDSPCFIGLGWSPT